MSHFSENLVIGSRSQDQTHLIPNESKQKAVDLVTVFVPEVTSDNQVYCKSVTSILSSQDYQNYLPVYRPLTEPLYSTRSSSGHNKCTVCLFVSLFICVCIFIASIIFGVYEGLQ